MKVLVINSGSSSIKYQLFDMRDRKVMANGLLEQIGENESHLKHQTLNSQGGMADIAKKQPVKNHQEGFRLISNVLNATGAVKNPNKLYAIGHRVVHGGDRFRNPTLINKDVIDTIRELIPLAPLHNPPNLLGIEVAAEIAPDVPQVAVFDTAFHQTIPPQAYRYALPGELYTQHRVRRYGFHGTSHYYVAKQAAVHLNRPIEDLNLITLHLGNGASVAAVQGGRSIDTSMGMTPLEGLIMGTRCGDIDPAIIFYLQRKTGQSSDEIDSLLNKASGLKGICGINDMRQIVELAQSGNTDAQLAIDMYCYRVRKYIGSYFAALGQVDALVFTGGIGENAAAIRAGACDNLSRLGIKIDQEKNNQNPKKIIEIQTASSSVKVLVIPTNEELEIAIQTRACIENRT